MARSPSWIWGLALLALLTLVYASVFFAPIMPLFQFATNDASNTFEDGPVEYFGALSFLLSSLVFFAVWWNSTGNSFRVVETRRNVFYLLLGVMFFFGAGEEVSWGQRIFGVETPDWLKSINDQDEINLHNLEFFFFSGEEKSGVASLFDLDRMFSLFWLTYCFLIPVAARFNRSVAGLVKSFSVPLVPVGLGFVFPANYVGSKILETTVQYRDFDLIGLEMRWPGHDHVATYVHFIVEVKESLFGFLFVIVALHFFYSRSRRGETAAYAMPQRQEA